MDVFGAITAKNPWWYFLFFNYLLQKANMSESE
jgi:hypothetical protein